MGRKIFRASSLFIGTCGIGFYSFVVWLSSIEWRQAHYAAKPLLEQIWFVIDFGIFFPGLPPLMLTIYFLILKKSVRANRTGLIYVALFIPIHYYVASMTAHMTPEFYLPAQLTELAAAIALIAFWKERPANATATL